MDYSTMTAQELEYELAQAEAALRQAQQRRDTVAAAFEAALAEIRKRREVA